ncbi:LCP family protein [Corynebacterium tapiri]|nr:LCP family protein [Corynebacterium tapiri]
MVDRYGRPIRRRNAPRAASPQRPAPERKSTYTPRRRPPRREQPPQNQASEPAPPRPRQYIPPRQPARQQPPRQQQPQQGQQRYSAQPPREAYYPPASVHDEPLQVAPRAQKPPRRRRNPLGCMGCFGCFGWMMAIVLVLAVVTGLWADARLNRVDAMPAQQISNTAGTNWLLVGSDSRLGLSDEQIQKLGTGGDVGVGRTDTIMLLHMTPFGKAKLISIPRDSYVSIPGYGENKINAAFTYGGPKLLTETVEQETGLHIDHYAEIGMGGLANLVDSVGGVEICVKEPIQDPLANIDVQPGCQRMEGPTALGYVRTRATALGDLDRVQRQREFFSALVTQITKPQTILNPFRMIPLIAHTTGTFTVDESDHVWHLARVALAMARGVETETIPVGGFTDTSVGNVVLWDEAAAEALFASMR